MPSDFDHPSSSKTSSRSRHQGIYKDKAEREEWHENRRNISVEIRKKKKDEKLFERRSRHIDASNLNVENELGENVIRKLMSSNPLEIKEGIESTIEVMNANLIPLGLALANSGLVSKIAQSLTTHKSLVLRVLRNLDVTGPNFINNCDESSVFISITELMKEDRWSSAIDQILFAACIILENSRNGSVANGTMIFDEALELISQVNGMDIVLLRNVVWMSSLLIRKTRTEAYTLPLLVNMTHKLVLKDFDVTKDVCTAIEVASTNVDNEEFIMNEAIPLLISLISPLTPPKVVGLIMHTFTVFFEESREYVDKSISSGLLNVIPLTLSMQECAADACWILTVIADAPSLCDLIIENESILINVGCILKKGTYGQRKEAVEVLSKISCSNDSRVDSVIFSSIAPLCDILTVIDASLVSTVLNILKDILERDEQRGSNRAIIEIEESGGLSKMEFLQHNQIMEISLIACEIIDRYFDNDNDENDYKDNDYSDCLSCVINHVVNGDQDMDQSITQQVQYNFV